MASKLPIITAAINTAIEFASDEKVQTLLFGKYSDGTPRSFSDCLDGEILSPKDREKLLKKKKGKKSKKKKKKSKVNL